MSLRLSQAELEKLYTEGKYMIWNYKTLYQIHPKNNANNQFYLFEVVKYAPKGVGVTLKGRYIAMTPEVANSY